MNQRVASSMLKQHGYSTDISNHGGEAIEALQRKAYDLVFMDVQVGAVRLSGSRRGQQRGEERLCLGWGW